jgi:hypothetical protein
VQEYVPENCQKDYDRRIRDAYAMNYTEAKAALDLPATGKNQFRGCPQPGGRAGGDANGASLGYRRRITAETSHYHPIESCLQSARMWVYVGDDSNPA